MTRLDGEKKSPMPWIIGLIVLALLAAAIYYFAVAKGTDAVVTDGNGIELIDNAPGGLGIDNSANVADMNAVDANTTDTNMADTNAMDANSTSTSAMDSNSTMDSNSATATNSATDTNSAMMGGTASNMADTNAADANSAMMGNDGPIDSPSTSMSGVPVPGMAPSSTDTKPAKDGVVATRSKTIKTDDKTVIYQKSVKADGTVMRDKKIVGKPVEEAKKQ